MSAAGGLGNAGACRTDRDQAERIEHERRGDRVGGDGPAHQPEGEDEERGQRGDADDPAPARVTRFARASHGAEDERCRGKAVIGQDLLWQVPQHGDDAAHLGHIGQPQRAEPRVEIGERVAEAGREGHIDRSGEHGRERTSPGKPQPW
jgi:hypothetical protein